MASKKLLLICNTFPPSPGIGGRRWAKFSKYLSRKDYQIHVASSENLSRGVSEWSKDVENNSSIITHPLHFKYRRLFLHPKNIFEKIARKAIVQKLSSTKYSERFITSLPNEETWKKVKELILKENIKTIVVSADPFLFYYATQLKKQTGCKLILDYRDLWNDHSYYKTHYKLTSKQQQFFEEAENSSLLACDAVITVDEYLKETIAKRLPQGQKNKICVIHNGFDADDFNLPLETKKKSNKTVLYFSGNIASDLNEIVIHFAKCFQKLKQSSPDIYKKFEIHIKGKMDKSLFEKISSYNLENLIVSNNFISIDRYTEELEGADMGIVILSKEYANSYTTKFSDYLFLNKKTLVLGLPGAFSQFLEKNNCGSIFTLSDDSGFFEKLLAKTKAFSGYPKEVKDQFDINHLTEKAASLLESLAT